MFGTLSGVAASAPAAGRRRLAATAKEAIAAVCPNDPCGRFAFTAIGNDPKTCESVEPVPRFEPLQRLKRPGIRLSVRFRDAVGRSAHPLSLRAR